MVWVIHFLSKRIIMKSIKKSFPQTALLIVVFVTLTTACYQEEIVIDNSSSEDTSLSGNGLADWTEATHTFTGSPNYDVVFPQDKVNRIDINISSEDWANMLDDLTTNIGAFGSGGGMPGGGGPGGPGGGPGGPGGGAPLMESESSFTPVFSQASVFLNDIEWYNVGVRFKGNSSLRNAWQSGSMKLSLRFDFDEFEEEHPEIKNQRFYGFQKLAFSSNFEDVSFLHEKMAADIFRDAGLKAPQTAYYSVYINYGEGAKYFGLYTAVEIVEDTMLDTQFGNSTGNCYKPEGTGATFASGSFNTSHLEKKTNDELEDWSDVKQLYTILNSSTRNTDTEQWKTDLETIFDVDNYMHWLAVNTVIQNWDTYGVMNHNYYLYNDPSTQKIVWIPWDNNEALSAGKRTPLSFSMSEVSSAWPLISYLIDIPEYYVQYENYLNETIHNAFEPTKIKAKYEYWHNLIEPYVREEVSGYTFMKSPTDFTNALTTQKNHVDSRFNATTNYLNK